MIRLNSFHLTICLACWFNHIILSVSQPRPFLRLCTVSENELKKCQQWSNAVEENRMFQFYLRCEIADNKDHCMKLIENQKADFVLAEPGEIYIAGRFHSLVPIVYEQYGPINATGYYAVSVVRTNSRSYIQDLRDLRDKKACFSGVGQLAGWILPIVKLLEMNLIDTIDCNNVIQNAAHFFGSSCAPNALIDKNNPIGTNPQSICSLCDSKKCSGNDLFARSEGTLSCLLRKGDVAFLKHTVIDRFIKINKHLREEIELFCPNGNRAPLDNYNVCNWGYVPPHAILVSSAVLPETRERIQKFLIDSSIVFNKNSFISFDQSSMTTFNLFESSIFGFQDLIFSDDASSLVPVDKFRQTFRGYFGLFNPVVDVENLFSRLRKCDVPNARLCVTSTHELEKCNNMKSAFRTNLLKPQLSCVLGENTVDCMQQIQDGQADLAMLDAADVHLAGQRYNLEPIMAEQNNINDSYYVVAVAKKADLNTDLLYLKGKRSCHSGYRTAAGWVVPMSFLLTNSRIRSYGCDSIRAASEFFSKSCIPGVLSQVYNRKRSIWQFKNLCSLCHGESFRFCRRDSSEQFFGDTGAFQCLIEGGGDVAFVKHSVIFENTNGINPEFWARDKFLDDFELLCRDGSRSEVQDYSTCHLGQVATNALVTNRFKPFYEKEAYITLFVYAQQFYGSKYSNEYTFKMFVSDAKHKNLIFQDSTVKLKPIETDKRDYRKYLGHEFLTAINIVDCESNRSSSLANDFVLKLALQIIVIVISINH
ncbi:Melanotransferrin [Sarcoptes scabiei]|uniref:Melanotransferrin n=1 Tax=Sarcoptes scabiei TaxID=52283 RepID=A0A834R694_SARSC|nr:Melanotransferrin [Sarcoptes scabiei]